MSDDFDDLDNELLGLGDEGELDDDRSQRDKSPAGDESEGAVSDTSVGSSRRKNKVTTVVISPSPPPASRSGAGRPTVSDDESDTPVAVRKGVAASRKRPSPGDEASSPPKKRTKAGKKTTKRKRRGGDSDDEDEASDYSDEMNVSGDSDAVVSQPATSDDEDGGDVAQTLYPFQGLYKSAADKVYVESLPELQKETILAERAEELFKLNEAKEMKARAQRQRREAEKRDRKEAEAIAAASGARRSTRGESSAKRTADSKKSAQLSELMKKRDEKNARKAGAGDVNKAKKKRKDTPDRSDGEEDEDDVDEPSWTLQSKTSSSDKRGSEEASLADIRLLIVGRSIIAKYWSYPGFEEATVGCFARVCIGNHPETGRVVYRLCIIKGWQDSRHIYEITGSDRTVKFRRNAIIASAADERPTRVDVFSDSAPTEDEFRWWNGAMDVAGIKRPTVAFVEKKRRDTKQVWQRQLTNEDFEEMRRKRTSYFPEDPIIADLDVPGLRQLRAKLVDEGNESEILRIDKELEWRTPPKAISSQYGKVADRDKLGQINKRNREINRHDIRQAQIEEKKRNEMAAKLAAENGDSSFMDPFARVKTHAKIYHNDQFKNGEKDEDVDMDDLFGGDEPKDGKSPNPAGNGAGAGLGKMDNKVPQVKTGKPKGIDAAIASLDLQFDIDFTK
ncbi:hypothetical protein ABW19_dt0201510 [Dactylella cylindrospora]|nr:hypothetical protein ABW19_dt0201510 [Dactylella cylindrospora]